MARALRDLEQAFAKYPRRPVLERCSHCGPPVRVADADLFWLSLKLGNTVGGDDDVKALLPLLFERLTTTDELDPDMILGKLAHLNWRSWPTAERNAVNAFLDQVWLVLLSEPQPSTGGFTDAAGFPVPWHPRTYRRHGSWRCGMRRSARRRTATSPHSSTTPSPPPASPPRPAPGSPGNPYSADCSAHSNASTRTRHGRTPSPALTTSLHGEPVAKFELNNYVT